MPEPRTELAPLVMVKTEEVDSVRLPLVTVSTPVEVRVASPERALVIQEEPSAISRLPAVAVVKPKVLPLILATVVAPWVPVTSPAKEPVKLVEVATVMV